MHHKRRRRHGFTLLEVLLVVAIIGALYSIVFWSGGIQHVLLKTREARARAELGQIYRAVHMWVLDHGGEWPVDESRGLPSGIEEYLGDGSWPDAPFNDVSQYDWDSFIGSDGNRVYQISIRFCPLNHSDQCKFPDAEWAENFDYYSSFYFCIQGKCRSHPGKPDDHPGYCVNCQ